MLDWADIDEADLQSILDEEDNVKTRIIFAREELKVLASTDVCVFRDSSHSFLLARYLLPLTGGGFVPFLVCLRKLLYMCVRLQGFCCCCHALKAVHFSRLPTSFSLVATATVQRPDQVFVRGGEPRTNPGAARGNICL